MGIMRNKTIVALGFFDGVHLGHQALLTECLRLAKEHGCKAAAVTFDTHPQTLTTGAAPKMINTVGDRDRLLKAFGMEEVIHLPFDEHIRTMPWHQFLMMLGEQYGTIGFVCGDDFRFGYKGQGNADLLKEYCQTEWHPCGVVSEQVLDGIRVSSTHIRTLIEAGEMERANRFLGHRHILTGQVVSGRKLGHTLGFPTANVLFPEGVVQPKSGVYACRVCIGGLSRFAVCNVGSRPTVNGHQTRTESWVLDFSGDLYGKEITIEFCKFLRPEQRFDSLDELKQAVEKDAKRTREYFAN